MEALVPHYSPVRSCAVGSQITTDCAPAYNQHSHQHRQESEVELYVLELANSPSSELLGAATSDGQIRILDKASLRVVGILPGHAGLAGYLRAIQPKPAHVRRHRRPRARARLGPAHRVRRMDVACDDVLVAAGTELSGDSGSILIWDSRASRKTLHTFHESHTDDVTSLEFHPHAPARFVTGSEDGLVCLFDLNVDMTSQVPTDMVVEEEATPEEKATLAVMNAEASVHRVGIFGPSGEFVYALTGSQELRLWNGAEASQLAAYSSVRESLNEHCMNANAQQAGVEAPHVDYLIATKYHAPSERFYLIGGDFSGGVHFAHVSLSSIDYIRSLRTSAHNAVIRCVDWDGPESLLYTGGEDELVCQWSAER
ncbi:hypothetical protein CAOG_00818 [Capsaspora owczarzaki ATCC 30864]|uniref:hypothetical protein n=1 Tax=Capsaspora owczarzaki (strain ATCC 30864) TaxID=595528 RepID=UPI0003520B5C|nr:hypothetical protein CAOG_00818 [Capsaspora owczarzaki ATCC 30864]|eukprot:XP_004365689.2 hypothetical protein CAOG_00818 [Capsaspora owczarzaki ATCC 30864]